MKPTSLLLALAAAATTQISAAPGPLPSQVGARETFNPTLFLYGVDDDSDAYTLIVRTDNYSYPIANPLSVGRIQLNGGAACTIYGIDGTDTYLVGAQTKDVGPPQAQVGMIC